MIPLGKGLQSPMLQNTTVVVGYQFL